MIIDVHAQAGLKPPLLRISVSVKGSISVTNCRHASAHEIFIRTLQIFLRKHGSNITNLRLYSYEENQGMWFREKCGRKHANTQWIIRILIDESQMEEREF